MEYRQFTKHDWYGNAGATKPENSEPLLAFGTLDGQHVEFVADASGLHIALLKEDGTLEYWWRPLEFKEAALLLSSLQPDIKRELLPVLDMWQGGTQDLPESIKSP
jgi:hypothetical protein